MPSEMILPLRSGYMLEYVPRGARRPRKALVSEVFPVKVRVDDSPEPAFDDGGYRGIVVSGGRLYNWLSMEEPTLERMAHLAAGGRDQIARSSTLFRHNDLLRQGAPAIPVFEAPLRDTIQIREIVSDGAAEGAAHAQRMADQLMVSDGVVHRLATNVPTLEMSVAGTRIWGGEKHYDQNHDGFWRSFRVDDIDGAWDFARRHAKRIGRGAAIDDRYLSRLPRLRWSEAGLAVERTEAWWVVRSADFLARNPLGISSTSTMDLDIDILQHLLAIRKILDPYRRDEINYGKVPHDTTMPSASEAVAMAREAIGRLQAIRVLLGHDLRQQCVTMARKVDLILEEATEHAPGLRLDDDDLDALASFGAAP